MRRALFFVATLIALGLAARGEPPPRETPSEGTARPKSVHVVLAKEGSDQSTTKFSIDALKIRALWNGAGLQAGDRVQGVWIADDVGATAPKHTTITEATVTAYKADDDGIFSLGRPKNGWPPGKYRFEIHVNKKLANAVNFTIQGGVTVEISGNQIPETPAPIQTSAPLQLDPSPAVQPKQ